MSAYFLAIPAVDVVPEAFTDLPHTLPGFRPVDPAQFHVTLCYLGPLSDHQLDEVILALSDIPTRTLTLSGEGLQLLPDGNQPRALVALIDPAVPLMQLQKRTTFAMQPYMKLKGRRKFRPHITLARLLPDVSATALAVLMTEFSRLRIEPSIADRMILYESRFSESGNTYQEVAVFPLGSNLLTETGIDEAWPLE